MRSFVRIMLVSVTMVLTVALLAGCATVAQSVGLAIMGGTAYLARTPSNEIEQIYYLGTFDPQEQIPPTIYRVRVHGQASAMSQAKFASGWVKAGLIDSLGTQVGFESGKSNNVTVGKGLLQNDDLVNISSGRRMVVFGPEGFREAPKDHRMVIVMGASPEAFFNAIDQSLGEVAGAQSRAANEKTGQKLSTALLYLMEEDERLKNLTKDVAADFPVEAR